MYKTKHRKTECIMDQTISKRNGERQHLERQNIDLPWIESIQPR